LLLAVALQRLSAEARPSLTRHSGTKDKVGGVCARGMSVRALSADVL
jgi:hypothetical protein